MTLSMWQRMWGSLDVASCREAGRLLQSYRDGRLDQRAARRVARHLDLCRRCGMEAATYAEIKAALSRRDTAKVDAAAVERLRAFGSALAAGEHPGGR